MADLNLNEVKRWKLEAADEDSKRYFYHADHIESLQSGQDCFVIGRKGTGKSAICRHFETRQQHDHFCIKLSFKEFPFNLLYSLEDKQFTNPSQYISLWKYFIYNSILKLMSSNNGLDSEFQQKIQSIHPSDEFKYIGSVMQKWTQKSFAAGIMSLAGSKTTEVDNRPIEEIWPELIPAMENIILKFIDTSNYFIVFDELDEDYRNYWDEESRVRYISLITSLLKAVSNVRRVMFVREQNVKPIVFLRDDIYELLTDIDKNKWEDSKISLNWKRAQLKNLIAFRLARSRDPGATQFDFNSEWDTFVQSGGIQVGSARNKKFMHSFDYILAATHARPRDLVRYLKEAAESSMDQGHKQITRDTIRGADSEYSNHFRDELVNEIGGLIPDISPLLEYIAQLRKQRHKHRDFLNLIESYQASDECDVKTKALTPLGITKILFHFSVIGNANRRNNVPVYRYQKPKLALNPTESLVLHRGLLRTLGLH